MLTTWKLNHAHLTCSTYASKPTSSLNQDSTKENP